MAVPKKRQSHSRTRLRRSHDFLSPTWWLTCPQCNDPQRPHVVCANCGYYRSKEVVPKQAP